MVLRAPPRGKLAFAATSAVASAIAFAVTGVCHAAPVGNADAGRAAFVACAACHPLGPSARSGFGPQLNGIFGRVAGSTAGYSYSVAMKNSKIVWSSESLAAFIRNPDRVVPGTKMRFSSFGFDDRKIADILAYLRTMQAVE